MKLKIYFKGKKISKKKAIELIGEKRLEERIKEAKQSFYEDPYELNSWMDGMEIRFEI